MAKKKSKKKAIGDLKGDNDPWVDVADHRHCVICGKPIAPGNETCSPACQAEYDANIKKRKTYTMLLYGSVIFVIILLLIQLGSGG